MKALTRGLIVTAGMRMGALLALAQQAVEPQGLQPILDKFAGSLGNGGIVAAALSDGQVRYLTSGKPSPHEGVAAERIEFEIGSITKVFTALMLAEAVNEGKCRLDDPIGKFLPPSVGMTSETAAITLAQLSTHTSGLPRLPTNFAPANPADPYADYTVERLYEFLRAYKVDPKVERKVDYSNLGAGLLGHILELINHKPYAALLAEKITGPLGLKDTTIDLDSDQQARFATPYSGSQPVSPWNLGALQGAGAIRSTAADMTGFAKALLSPDSVIAAAWNTIKEPRAELGNSAGRIGLGIFIGEINGRIIYNHSGGTGGFRSYLELDPQRNRALVILINNDAVEPAGIAATVNAPSSRQASGREEVPISAADLSAYTGVYEIDARARFTVLVDDEGRLRIRLTGQAFLPSFYAGNDRFFLKVVAAEFQFSRGADGKVGSLTLFQNGRQIAAKKTAAPAPKILFPGEKELAAYDGHYQLAPGAIFEISHRGAVLYAKLTGQPAFPVHNDAPDHFVYDVVEAALTFERDASGSVVAVVLHQNGADRRSPRVP